MNRWSTDPRTLPPPTASSLPRATGLVIAGLALLALFFVLMPMAEATHYRGGTLSWQPTGSPGEIELTGNLLFTRAAMGGAVGTTYTPGGSWNWGDGTTSPFVIEITSINAGEGYAVGKIVNSAGGPLRHTYSGNGPYSVTWGNGNRISASSGHINNPDGRWALETVIDLSPPVNSAPTTQLPPVVPCSTNSVCSFRIPATDSEGNLLSFRLATATEAAGAGFPWNPIPGLTVNSATGDVTWNTTGRTLAASGPTFYSAQIMIQDGRTKAPVDFMIQLVTPTTPPPSFVSPTPACGASLLHVTQGHTLTFDVKANSTVAGRTVALNHLGLPSGATFPLPSAANPVSSTFTWTPTATGSFVVTFTAQDNGGQSAPFCSISIAVDPAGAPSAVFSYSPSSPSSGQPVSFTDASTTPDGTITNWEWQFGDGQVSSTRDPTHTYSTPGTYSVQLQVTNSFGYTGRSTQSIVVTNSATAPAAPTNLVATGGVRQIALTWTAPATGGSAITNYQIFRQGNLLATIGANTSFVDATLGDGQTATYTVTAVNAIGVGSQSASANATTATLPAQVPGLATTRGLRQVGLSWNTPADGGSPITAYKIYRGAYGPHPSALFATVGANTSFLDLQRNDGEILNYAVSAVTLVGEGAKSATVSGSTYYPPNAPYNEGANPSAPQELRLFWLAPVWPDAEAPVLGYRIYREGNFLAQIGTNTTYHDAGLANGATHTYTVIAFNIVGDGPASAPFSATTWNVPSAPLDLAAANDAGAIALTWNTPADNGGRTVSEYSIYRDGAYLATVGYNMTFVDTNAGGVAGGSRTYTVRGHNIVGAGPASDSVTITPFVAPVTTLTTTGTLANGWYVSGGDTTLVCAPAPGDTCAATYYELNGNATQLYTGALALPDGEHSVSFWSVGANGGAEGAKVTTLKLDRSAPTVRIDVVCVNEAATWCAGDAHGALPYAMHATGTSSGLASMVCEIDLAVVPCSGALGTDGMYAFRVTATNGAGTQATSTLARGLDTTPPMITASRTPAPNANGWTHAEITVSFTCADVGGSGTSAIPAQLVASDGADQERTGVCTDAVGNSASVTLGGLNVDKTAPTMTLASVLPAPNAYGWNSAPVTATWTCEDATSGATSSHVWATVSVDGEALSLQATCHDLAGNEITGEVGGIHLDQLPPVLTLDSRFPAPNAAGWNNEAIILSWTCTDALSGTVDFDATKTLASEGADQSMTNDCVDRAGWSVSDTQGALSVDLTPPTIEAHDDVVVSADSLGGATVDYGYPAVGDALSGVSVFGCERESPSYFSVWTTSTVVCSASDAAGNGATTTFQVTVTAAPLATISVDGPVSVVAGTRVPYTFSGFDRYGNVVPLAQTSRDLTAPTLVGPTTVSYEEDGIIGSLDIMVVHDILARIDVDGPTTMVVTTTVQFEVAGSDQYGNDVPLAIGAFSYTAPEQVGAYAVEYVEDGILGSLIVEVIADALARIDVTGPATIWAGYNASFDLAGFDRFGNAVSLGQLTVEASAPDKPGSYSVSYQELDVVGVAFYDSVLPPVARVEVLVGTPLVNVNQTRAVRAVAYDENARPIPYAQWTLTTTFGYLTSTGGIGEFSSPHTGVANITATSGGMSDTKSLTIDTPLGVKLVLEDGELTLVNGLIFGEVRVRYLDGAPVRNASVRVVLSSQYGTQTSEGATNAEGIYRFRMIAVASPPGDYKLTANATWSLNSGEDHADIDTSLGLRGIAASPPTVITPAVPQAAPTVRRS